MQIAVSGANGFVGRALCKQLCDAGHGVIAIVRRSCVSETCVRECLISDDNFAGIARGMPELGRCDVFIHLAARVHVMQDQIANPLAAYRTANVEGALNAAAAALRSGARRLVFVSSVKALGEGEPGRPWREDDQPAPVDPYGISKFEAEQALTAFGWEKGIEIVIVRPPLVYGPGVRANFRDLMKASRSWHSVAARRSRGSPQHGLRRQSGGRDRRARNPTGTNRGCLSCERRRRLVRLRDGSGDRERFWQTGPLDSCSGFRVAHSWATDGKVGADRAPDWPASCRGFASAHGRWMDATMVGFRGLAETVRAYRARH